VVASSGAPSPERWAAIEPLCDRALDLPPENRSDFLAEACATDPALREEVERLLQAGEAPDEVLGQPAHVYASPLIARVAECQTPSAGEWIGSYLIEGKLGQGGMATVYLAHDPRHGRRVALKVLRAEISSAAAGERFAREIAIAARLTHPHILPLYDSGVVKRVGGPPLLFYTRPYIPGPSLRDRLRQEPRLPVGEAIEVSRQVAAALDYAHREGVIHRDIKPGNILMAEGGARVADFGIARALDVPNEELTASGLAVGTPAYMSPELTMGSARLDGRADIYALGCMLYEMLTGEPPFTGPTAQAVLARHAMDPVPSLQTVRPEVGAGLSSVVRRALAKVPADRYPTAAAFAEALASPETASSDSDQAAAPPRNARLLHRPVLLGGAILVLALGAVLVKSLARRSPAMIPDPGMVAVAPFRVASSDSALGYLREGMVDLLTTKLGGTLSIRPLDSRTLLNAWHEDGRRSDDLSGSEALDVARRLGAGLLIGGEVVANGPQVTLSATLRRTPDGREAARVSVEGPSDSLSPLIDRLAAQLLARAAGEPEERLAALAATSAPALRDYLDGWTLFRGGASRDDAIRRFERAVAADSGFALAALGAARAIYDSDRFRRAPSVMLAWRLRDRLTPSDRAYLTAVLGPRYPEASTPREFREALERVLQLSPTNGDAWMWYGVWVCAERNSPGMPARCRAATLRALVLDSLNTITVGEAVERYQRLRDTADLRRTLRLYLDLDSVSPTSVFLQWSTAMTLGDSVNARRLALSDSMVSVRTDGDLDSMWRMVHYFLREGRGFADLEAVLRQTLAIGPTEPQQDMVARVRYRLATARGRATGVQQPAHWPAWHVNYRRVMDALFLDADPAPAVAASATLERGLGSPMEYGCCLQQFAAAQAALAAGRLAPARRAMADILRFRAKNPEVRTFELILAAQIAAREGAPETAAALTRLDSAMVDWRDWMGASLVYGDLIAARLHEERGDYDAALAALRRRSELAWLDAEVVTYYREEGRIAALAGDTAGAVRAYERYLRIRAEAEPRLRPQVERVRAELAALTRSR